MSTEMQFHQLMLPFIPHIQKYCLYLSGNTWDADDLYQETLIRIHRALNTYPDRTLSIAYFRRIVYTSWLDIRRKSGPPVAPLLDGRPSLPDVSWDSIDLREAFELFAHNLTIRQMIYMLLVEIFGYTAKDAAVLIHASEGAVKEGMKRARKRLHQLNHMMNFESPRRSESLPDHSKSNRISNTRSLEEPIDPSLFESFLQGIREGNPRIIYETYNALNRQGVRVMSVNVAAQLPYVLFRDPDGHVLSFFSRGRI